MRILKFIRYIFKKFPMLLAANTLLLVATSLIDALSLFSLVVVADLLLNPGLEQASPVTKNIVVIAKNIGLPVTLGWLLGVFLFFNVLRVVFQIFARNSILRTKYAVLRDMILGTFKDFFSARWYFFSSGKQGVLLNTFIREINVVGDAFGAIARYFAGILQIALYLTVPLYLSWRLTSISLAIALLFALPFFLLGKVVYRLGKVNTTTANQIGTVIQEGLSLAKLILGFANQKKTEANLACAFDNHRQAAVKSQTLTYALPLMYYPFGLLVLIIGFILARKMNLPLSDTAVLFYSLARIIPCIGSLTEEKAYLDNFFPSYEQVQNLRNTARELKQASGAREFKGFNKEIAVCGLCFGYHEHPLVLADINMRVPKGRMVALVGESGSGKSTLIDMLMGFHQPQSGGISFDGIPLGEFDINSYRRRIGYVPQDSVLFNLTIMDNLRWADISISDEAIIQACRQANADEFISKLPEGYHTLVGDRGVRLSGGQVQRIALARAILRRPELLILDEATSALDTYSERLIQQAIEAIAKETTVVIIAHRLSTVINANYIYVLKSGRVVEEGGYAELIAKNSHFNEMVRLQNLGTAGRAQG